MIFDLLVLQLARAGVLISDIDTESDIGTHM